MGSYTFKWYALLHASQARFGPAARSSEASGRLPRHLRGHYNPQRDGRRADITNREHPADEVYVTGTFDDWGKTVKLEKGADGVFTKTVQLPHSQDNVYYKVSGPVSSAAIVSQIKIRRTSM